MCTFTSSSLIIFIHLPSFIEWSSWNFRTRIKANDWQEPSACWAAYNFSPALDILFIVLICVHVLMCVCVRLWPDTQLTPIVNICHTHNSSHYKNTARQQLLSLRGANHHSAFTICCNRIRLFQAFFHFQALKQKILRKIFSGCFVVGVLFCFFFLKKKEYSRYPNIPPPYFSFFFLDFLHCSPSLPLCLPFHSLFNLYFVPG